MIPGTVVTQGQGIRQLQWINSASVNVAGTSFNFGNFVMPFSGALLVLPLGQATSGTTQFDPTTSSVGGAAPDSQLNVTAASNPRGVYSRGFFAKGESVNVTLTSLASLDRAAIGVWALSAAGRHFSPIQTTFNQATAASQNITLNLRGWGISLYGIIHRNTNATSWSGATSRGDITVGTSRFSWADKLNNTGALVSSDTVTPSWTGSVSSGTVGLTQGVVNS